MGHAMGSPRRFWAGESQATRGKIGRLWGGFRACIRAPEHLLFWGIILLAAALRLSYLDVIEFKADEAIHLQRSLEIIAAHRLPLESSPASVGIAKPPMMDLLMTIPLLVGRDPRIASTFIALLNVAAVAGAFLLGRKYYSLRVAAIAATLFAVNPWAVILSRKVFTADLLAPWQVLFLYGLLAALVERKAWGWLVAVVALGIALNVTFSPLPLVLALLVLLAIYHRRINWRYLLAGAALVVLLFAPYLYAQLGHLQDIRNVAQQAAGQKGSLFHSLKPTWEYALDLHSGGNLGSLAGAAFPAFAPARNPLRGLEELPALLFGLSLVAIVAMALYARFRRKGREDTARYVIPAVWLLTALAGVALQNLELQFHYLVILYPAGFLAMALTADWLWRALGARAAKPFAWAQILRWALGAGLLCALVWQGYSLIYLYHFVAQADASGGYGVPLRYWQSIAGMARREAAAAGVDEVWVITNGTDISYEQAPIVLQYLLGPDKAIFLGQGGSDAVLLPVGRPAVYLFTRPLQPLIQAIVDRFGGQEKGSFPNPDGHTTTHIVVAPAHSLADTLSLLPQVTPAYTLASGLTSLGYEAPASAHPGDTVSFATYWLFGNISPAEQNVAHNLDGYLLNDKGEKVAERGGFGLPERYWRAGLVLAQWSELQLPADAPAGTYTLHTGMYRLPDKTPDTVRDEGNTVVGDTIPLGSIAVAP